jgi:hypothetical protein
MPTLSDDVAPNFFTVNAKGEITAEFSGTINAFGLILPEEEKVGNASEMKWVDGEGKTHSLLRSHGLPVTILELIANSENVGEQGRVILRAQGPEPAHDASVLGLASKSTRSVTAIADALEALIINHLGKSSFLQLLLEEKLRLSFGVSQPSFTLGSNLTPITTVSHGLGAIPKFVLLGIKDKNLTATLPIGVYQSETPTEVSFKFQAWRTGVPATEPIANIYWAAFG